MLEALLIYSLACYMVYHVVGQSDLLSKPRAWVLRTFPGWLTYPLSCSLCFTFWLTLMGNLFGFVQMDLVVLFAAPVVNMVLDLIVRALIRANEPPVMGEGKTLTCGDQSATTWRAPFVSLNPEGYAPFTFGGFRDEPIDTQLVGRLAKRRGDGLVGPIESVYRCGDDCANSFGKVCYRIKVEGGTSKVEASQCDLIDTPFNPLDHEQTR